MSKTDKTRPWWVGMADAPMLTCVPVHDHRDGPCTLPEEITAATSSLNRSGRSGCYWGATDHYLFDRGALSGGREWYHFRREERRRSRRQARRELRAYNGED
ncbi:hypothetical protein GCM10023085_06310 [Actinomadura viridis]|uniref:Uncharacterized protein n=1 Tax=Actinomadura viridis TaxID=58110 RepID=A0A931DPG0_9ACTN|nr:hypothetical protein [Actinomadura viridis]MBG6091647.1 hypothetical protein [Actinomadura viridis]